MIAQPQLPISLCSCAQQPEQRGREMKDSTP
jgi:hypothetical protein